MKRKAIYYFCAAALMAIVALYCFSGYAMHASFSVADNRDSHARAAVIWGAMGLVAAILAIGTGVAAWRSTKRE